MVVKKGNAWCVVHAGKQKKDVPQDKPAGTSIKCYPFTPGDKKSESKAKRSAAALHFRIVNGRWPWQNADGTPKQRQ